MSSYSSPSGQTVEIIFRAADRHGRFSAHLGQMELVTASRQPFCDAARVLYKLAYHDTWIIVARHDGASHELMRGPIGSIRRLTVREDKNGPRFVDWQPFDLRRVEPRYCNPPHDWAGDLHDRTSDMKPNVTHRSRTPKSGSASSVLRPPKRQSTSGG